ncbi:hypothetical protein AB6D74_01445 [Vibrio cyclitrophicus]
MINRKPNEIAPKLWVEVIVFVSAYYPLFFILLISDSEGRTTGIPAQVFNVVFWISPFGFGLFMLSSFAFLLSARALRKQLTYQEGGTPIQVSESQQIRGDMLNYTLPFLIGLFAFDYKSWQSVASLLLFLSFLFAFTHKERISLLNPMFLLLGVRLYQVVYQPLGQSRLQNKTVICMGEIIPSSENIYIKQTAGIEFAYPSTSQERS